MLYALGGVAGGLTLYLDAGHLVYEYNMMMIERSIGRSAAPLAAGKHRITITTAIPKPAGPADVSITVDGTSALHVPVARTVPGAFSASETLDVGTDLGSPVSLAYFDRAPSPSPAASTRCASTSNDPGTPLEEFRHAHDVHRCRQLPCSASSRRRRSPPPIRSGPTSSSSWPTTSAMPISAIAAG